MSDPRNTITFETEDENGEILELKLPSKRVACDRCEGYGTHLHPAIGEHAYTPEEFEDTFHDDEEREHYFRRGGMYDVPCEQCHGEKVIDVVDEDKAKETATGRLALKAWHAKLEEEIAYRRECEMERRMGA